MTQPNVEDPQQSERRYRRFHTLAIACLSTSLLFTSNIVLQHPIDLSLSAALFSFITAIVLIGLAYWWRNEDTKARDYPQSCLLLGACFTFAGIVAALWHVDPWFGGYFFIIGAIAILLLLYVSTRPSAPSRKR